MANRLYNKQVSPKGYQKGGSVKQSPMGSSSTKGNILRGKLKSQKELKKITDSKKYKDASYGEKTKMLNVATMKKGGSVKEEPMRDRKKQPLRTKFGGTKGKSNLFDPDKDPKKRKTEGFKMGGRARKMGGSLKPVQPNQKGLSKLPTEVRNKMGYMKKGGKVHGK